MLLLATLHVVMMDQSAWALLPTASVMLSAEIMETAVLILVQHVQLAVSLYSMMNIIAKLKCFIILCSSW